MAKEIKVAVIGAGFAGQAHAFGYRNASMADELQGVKVILGTIVDPNLELAKTVAERYGFDKAAGSIDDIINDPTIDAVSVALPNFVYIDVLPKLIKAGKHVLAEKPLGTSAAEAAKLAELAAASGRVAGVGFSFRRIPALAALQKSVREGRIGEVYFARAYYYADYAADARGPRTWRFEQNKSGGGAIIDIGTHAIDALIAALGPVEEVTSASLSTVIAVRPLPGGGIGHNASASATETGPVTNDDTALLTVKFTSGAVASVQLSRVAVGRPNQLGVEIFGSKGSVSFDSTLFDEFSIFDDQSGEPGFDGPRRVISGPAFPYYSSTSPMRARGTGTGYGEAFMAETQDFLSAIAHGHPMDTSFETTVHPMQVISAALESSATGRSVKVS
jgi:predicted dehydrogenase